ncbi:MAG: hypothetical protein Q7S31_00565 [bacterium]|nr:hypothetical protein [bacterium]
MPDSDEEVHDPSKRKFLRDSAILAVGILGGAAFGIAGDWLIKSGFENTEHQVAATAIALQDPEVRLRELNSLPEQLKNNSYRIQIYIRKPDDETRLKVYMGSCIAVEKLPEGTIFLTARHVAQGISPLLKSIHFDQPHQESEDIEILPDKIKVSLSQESDRDLALIYVSHPSPFEALETLPITEQTPPLPVKGYFLGFAVPTYETSGFHSGSIKLTKGFIPIFSSNDLEGWLTETEGDSGAPIMGEGGEVLGVLIGGKPLNRAVVEPIDREFYRILKNNLASV